MTRAELERSIVGAAGGFMVKAGRSTVADGTNPDLAGPIDSALRRAGLAPAAYQAPEDADLAAVPPGAIMYVTALANAEAFHSLRGWLAKVDQAVGPTNQKLSQYAAQAAELAAFWEERATAVEPSGPTGDGAAAGEAAAGVMAPYADPGAGGLLGGLPGSPWGWRP